MLLDMFSIERTTAYAKAKSLHRNNYEHIVKKKTKKNDRYNQHFKRLPCN